MKILHLTAHLGGGVGKVLSGLAVRAVQKRENVAHSFICLEEPQKSQFIDKILAVGCKIFIKPGKKELRNLVAEADIIQLEWWNHPATINCLCELSDIPLRLLPWSHVSGLHTPVIPQRLIAASHKFLFTSPCSYEAAEVKEVISEMKDKLDVVSSSGGFEGFPSPDNLSQQKISAGYIGSFNFAKLHPRYVDFLSAVKLSDFSVKMIGDLTNKDVLYKQSAGINRKELFDFRGYTEDVVSELKSINVLVYLLNPEHYGTTENALIEAMSMGIVPVVLDNPAEKNIVEDKVTGLIVRTPDEFASTLSWLSDNPYERIKIGMQASESVRRRFSSEQVESSLRNYYDATMSQEKRPINFKDVFGKDPAEWFLSCQKEKIIFKDDGSIAGDDNNSPNFSLFEKNKGTVFHFSRYFPQNLKLKTWAKNLGLLQ